MAKANKSGSGVPSVLPAETTTEGKAKKECPVTRKAFKEGAKPIIVDIGGQKVLMDKKEFSSGTFGWFANGTLIVTIGDVPVKVSFQCQAYVPNSKDAAAE